MRGRPKKPNEIKKIQGTEDKRWMHEEVKFEVAKKPLDFERDYKSIMALTVKQLSEIGIVSNVDMGLVEGYAKALERYFHADEMMRTKGMVQDGPNGLKPSVWFDIAERSLKQATQIGQLFGITPSARARIPQQQQPESKLEFLKKKIS